MTTLYVTKEVSLRREDDSGVFILSLNAPSGINPENRWLLSFCRAVHAAFDALETELACDEPRKPAALLTVSESPKFFSNGIDPNAYKTMTFDEVKQLNDLCMSAFARPILLPIPTVCAINGHCFGAGLMFALCHDYRLMRKDRGYACAIEVAIGLRTPSAEFTLFRHAVPANTFYQMVLLGERYTGEKAEQAGIVQTSCGMDELRPTAFGMARRYAKLTAAGAMAYYKQELKQFVAEEILRYSFPEGKPTAEEKLPAGLQAHVDRLVNSEPANTWGKRYRDLNFPPKADFIASL